MKEKYSKTRGTSVAIHEASEKSKWSNYLFCIRYLKRPQIFFQLHLYMKKHSLSPHLGLKKDKDLVPFVN
jgi:hypothetical protein